MRSSFTSVTFLVVVGCLASRALAAPYVELELYTEPGFPLDGKQRWLRALQEVGADSLRIRQAKLGDKGMIENVGTEAAPRYLVKGILSPRNQLRLPGGTFRMSDKAGIKAWIAKLRADGTEGLFARTGAFGLTSKQLVAVHQQLAIPVIESTKGKKSVDVAKKIIDSIKLNVVMDPMARQSFTGDELVAEELRGVSRGTALAAVLRPLGLVLVPSRPSGGETFLAVTDARRTKEVWPIGWPPEKSPGETLPLLFEFLRVEIDDFALSDALASIEERLKIPFLYDHNGLARAGVDPTQTKVSLPEMRTYYKKIIDRLLIQARPRLTSELRVDEAGKPFLWISPHSP